MTNDGSIPEYRRVPSARAIGSVRPPADIVIEINRLIDMVDHVRDELVELRERERRRL